MFLKLTKEDLFQVVRQAWADSFGTLPTQQRYVLESLLTPIRKDVDEDGFRTVLSVLDLLDTVYVLNPFSAPGLTFMGGHPCGAGPGQAGVTGVAITPAAAMWSLIGETVEWATLRNGQHLLPATRQKPRRKDQGLWFEAVALTGGGTLSVPAGACVEHPSDPGGNAGRSQGYGAGLSRDQSLRHALLELVERDATDRWWMDGREPVLLYPEREAADEISTFLGQINWNGPNLRLLSLQSATGIPVIAAVSFDENGRNYACGIAARAALGDAMRAAIVEMCQMEFGGQIILDRIKAGGTQVLSAFEKVQFAQMSEVDARQFRPFNPDQAKPLAALPDTRRGGGTLADLTAKLRQNDIDLYHVDLSGVCDGFTVSKLVSPQLRTSRAHISPADSASDIEKANKRGQYSAHRPLA